MLWLRGSSGDGRGPFNTRRPRIPSTTCYSPSRMGPGVWRSFTSPGRCTRRRRRGPSRPCIRAWLSGRPMGCARTPKSSGCNLAERERSPPVTTDRWAVTWAGQVVGWIESPYVDMPHYYGTWVASTEPESANFLTALRDAINSGGGLEVEIANGLRGIVYLHPDDSDGEIDIRWT